MQFEEKDIAYPPVHPGTDRTFIRFYGGEPDLNSIFYSSEEENSPQRIFVTDTNVASLKQMQPFVNFFRGENYSQPKIENCFIGTRGKDVLLILGSGEPFKTIESVLAICKAAIDSNAKRSAVFTGIGGGVITDMTAFAASIFKRGASCEFVPTTLLAMVDAAIGGKSGCDFDCYKNSIGTFFPAKALYVFPDFIQSLSEKEFISGFAEALKTALLFDRKLYVFIKENRDKILSRDKDVIFKIISFCAKAKAKVVQKDLTEKNIRMLLNFGHTFGHALESCAGLGTLTHGECVAWGIARALKTSQMMNLCSKNYYDEVCTVLKSFGYETNAVHKAFSDSNAILKTMKNDKKNSSSKIRLILQKDCCKNIITEVSDEIILKSLKSE